MKERLISPYLYPGLLLKKSRSKQEEQIKNKVEGILAVVSTYFGVPIETIKDKSTKKRDKVEAKKYFYYLCYKNLNLSAWSLKKINLLGDVHRNIHYHIEDIKGLSTLDKNTRFKIAEIEQYLK